MHQAKLLSAYLFTNFASVFASKNVSKTTWSLTDLSITRRSPGLLPPFIEYSFQDPVSFNVTVSQILGFDSITTQCTGVINSTAPYDIVRECDDDRFCWLVQSGKEYSFDDFEFQVIGLFSDGDDQIVSEADGAITTDILSCDLTTGIFDVFDCLLKDGSMILTNND